MKSSLSVCCLFVGHIIFAQEFSLRYELVKIGKQVNTFYHEAAPVISPDGKDLYFFVHDHPDNTHGKENTQDIWVSHKDDQGEWSAAEHAGPPLNRDRQNQVFTVFPDGSLLIRGGRGRDELGFSMVTPGGGQTELRMEGFKEMCKGRFYGATMSFDKKHMIIYFSEIPTSIKSDLYISHAQGDSWSRPVKMKITDKSDEFGPFLSTDNKTLYFASDRVDPKKQGGADIYKSTRLDDSWNNWSKPMNLARPINTAADDSYFTADAAGNVFTARANSRVDGGNLDIFILVPKDIKIMLSATVLNEKTNEVIPSANVILSIKDVDPQTLKINNKGKFETRIPETDQYSLSASAEGFLPKQLSFPVPTVMNDTTLNAEVYLTPVAKKLILTGTVYDQKTNAAVNSKVDAVFRGDRRANFKMEATDGKFEQEVSKLGWYILAASAEGYLNSTDSVEIASEEVTPIIKDLYLQPIEVGVTVRLKNIYFDFDRTTLKSESFVELDKVVDFLKTNSHVEIEIAGHTDSKGSDEYNANLSQGRSQSVVDYIVSQGIDGSRLTAHGYGESKPIETNDTEEGRANNRRVEFTVVKK